LASQHWAPPRSAIPQEDERTALAGLADRMARTSHDHVREAIRIQISRGRNAGTQPAGYLIRLDDAIRERKERAIGDTEPASDVYLRGAFVHLSVRV
jgi:hypothetical protein